jgi:DNA polymerase-3 subunit epsilon
VDACKEAVSAANPVAVTYRASGRAQERLEMVLLEVFSALDPPLVVGYLLPGRGRRTLRADRILRVEPASRVPR